VSSRVSSRESRVTGHGSKNVTIVISDPNKSIQLLQALVGHAPSSVRSQRPTIRTQ